MADLASHPVGQPLGGGGVSFGTDGIRGRVGTVMTPALALQVGYWSGQVLPGDAPVLLGMDSRSSGPCCGCPRGWPGCCRPGRVDPWLVPHPGGGPAGESVPGGWRLDGLGQPQPPEDNGIKLFGPSGAKLSRDQQQAIEAGLRGEVRPALTSCGPTQRRTELLESYTALLEKAWKAGVLMVAGSCLISAGDQPPPARSPCFGVLVLR